MEVPNSHLLFSSLRGWLLAAGEGRWKSATKPGLSAKWHRIWTCCLSADVGSALHNSAPSRRSQLYNVNLDKVGSCSYLTVGLRCIRASCGTSNNARNASDEGATWLARVGEATGGCSMSLPVVCPLMPELSLSRRSIMCSY